MKKTLEMVFRNQGETEVTVSLADPKDDLTSEQVQAGMDLILAKNIFSTKGGDLVDKVEARTPCIAVTDL